MMDPMMSTIPRSMISGWIWGDLAIIGIEDPGMQAS